MANNQLIFWLRIAYKELRFRTVLLMIVFEAVGYFSAQHTKNLSINFILMAVVLACLYMSATAFNDVSDFEIDKLNIPKDSSRPLMTMAVTKKQLTAFAYAVLIAAFIAALVVSPLYLLFASSGVILSVLYSVKPLRIANRGILAILWLPLSYVVLSFLGGAFINGGLNGFNTKIMIALYISFVGRIILKDFRDIKGDTKFGKKTFLVRHGTLKTCLMSAACWLLGDLVLSLSVWREFRLLVILMQPIIIIIIIGLYYLSKQKMLSKQLVTIQFIGIMANTVLITLLTSICLMAYQFSNLIDNEWIITVVVIYAFIATKFIVDRKIVNTLN